MLIVLSGIFDKYPYRRYYPTFLSAGKRRASAARRPVDGGVARSFAVENGMSGRQQATVRRSGAFDAFKLCARRGILEGTIEVADLDRLADRLSAASEGRDAVAWRISGGTDAAGRMALELALDGKVTLECQRCLESFTWPVAQRTLLLLAHDEGELAQLDEDDEHEVVLAAGPLDVRTLVEDELLLTLPFAPRCARPECTGPAPAMESETLKASAFAALAGMQRGTKRGK